MEWNKISDIKPEIGQMCLVTDGDTYCVGKYTKDINYSAWDFEFLCGFYVWCTDMDTPTHWALITQINKDK
jgi:hypothetical protein